MPNSNEYKELRAEFDELKAMFARSLNRKSFSRKAYELGKTLFWNWSFVLGLILGVTVIHPFVAGESGLSFRLPRSIQTTIQRLTSLLNPWGLKSLVPQGQSEKCQNLLDRLRAVSQNLKSEKYNGLLAARADAIKCAAPLYGSPDWDSFVEEFDARVNGCDTLTELQTKLDGMIEELK